MKIGFDNEKYLKMQSQHIRERIAKFDDKLYLEFGGKLFDDYHASRVLPGFQPDSKLQMLLQLKDQAEIVIVISAEDIESNKVRGDYGITYDLDVLRLIDAFQGVGLMVGSVCLTKFAGQPAAEAFQNRLESMGIRSYRHYKIPGYPSDVERIVSDEGYGRNDYIETSRPLVVITAPGPGSGKMATCLSQLYHEHKRGIKAGYAKFETFPIWNLPLKHPVNLAYEAATADLNDVNMIDSFHLEAYGETTVNYNRDIEIFPVVNAMFQLIAGASPYKSPTDMGVNMAGNCISDDAVCRRASQQEIIRRYYKSMCEQRRTGETRDDLRKLKLLMQQAGVTTQDRAVVGAALQCSEATGNPPAAAFCVTIFQQVCQLITGLVVYCDADILGVFKIRFCPPPTAIFSLFTGAILPNFITALIRCSLHGILYAVGHILPVAFQFFCHSPGKLIHIYCFAHFCTALILHSLCLNSISSTLCMAYGRPSNSSCQRVRSALAAALASTGLHRSTNTSVFCWPCAAAAQYSCPYRLLMEAKAFSAVCHTRV